MFYPPSNLTNTERCWTWCGWDGPKTVDSVEHLAVGLGAHHWGAKQAGLPIWFVTYDRYDDLADLEKTATFHRLSRFPAGSR